MVAIVQRWMTVDPEAVKAWVSRFPEGALRETAERAMAEVVERSARPVVIRQENANSDLAGD
jgi:hypothetical protein